MPVVTSIFRRTLLRSVTGITGFALATEPQRATTAAADEATTDLKKINKTDAMYQNHPKGQQRCEICLQFEPPNQCKIVEGSISATGWCQYFAAKENAH